MLTRGNIVLNTYFLDFFYTVSFGLSLLPQNNINGSANYQSLR